LTSNLLTPTACAICGPGQPADPLYEANFQLEDLNPMVFSARRQPDRIHYRMVRCRRCGLVRSDPVADPSTLSRLYRESSFDYSDEEPNLRRTYARYLEELGGFGVRKGALLEVGCGNGFLLDAALDRGWSEVRGVEPSRQAVALASPRVKPGLVEDVMRPGLFPPRSFDAVCLFQVFDHLPDPAGLLDECHRVLRPGGLLLCFNHNVEAVSARLLGERSPIVDIEHTYLYSLRTQARIMRDHGFEVLGGGPASNFISFRYLVQLLPLPRGPKAFLREQLGRSRLGRLTVRLPLGNLYVVGRAA